jgi:hypothetical protein
MERAVVDARGIKATEKSRKTGSEPMKRSRQEERGELDARELHAVENGMYSQRVCCGRGSCEG